MISLGAAKLVGNVLESFGCGEHSDSFLIPRTHPHPLLWPPTVGIFLLMFVYNMYLQLRNLSGNNPKPLNMLLLVSSTLLFGMITSVGYFFFPEALCPERVSHAFVSLAVGYRGRPCLRGRRGFGGTD